MILEGEDWKDKFVALGNNQTKARLMANGIFQKISDKLRQDGRTDQESQSLLKKLCHDTCLEQINNKGNEPVNQVWFQKVEDKVLRDFSH